MSVIQEINMLIDMVSYKTTNNEIIEHCIFEIIHNYSSLYTS